MSCFYRFLILASSLCAAPAAIAQTSLEREALKAALSHIVKSSSNVTSIRIASLTKCDADIVGFTITEDCADSSFTASGKARALAAAQSLADATGLKVSTSPLEEIRGLRTKPSGTRLRTCPEPYESAAIVIAGPLVELDPAGRWSITLSMFAYPLEFECEGHGLVLQMELVRDGERVRVVSSLLKRHFSGVHMIP